MYMFYVLLTHAMSRLITMVAVLFKIINKLFLLIYVTVSIVACIFIERVLSVNYFIKHLIYSFQSMEFIKLALYYPLLMYLLFGQNFFKLWLGVISLKIYISQRCRIDLPTFKVYPSVGSSQQEDFMIRIFFAKLSLIHL